MMIKFNDDCESMRMVIRLFLSSYSEVAMSVGNVGWQYGAGLSVQVIKATKLTTLQLTGHCMPLCALKHTAQATVRVRCLSPVT